MMENSKSDTGARRLVVRGLSLVEDFVYTALGILLAVCAVGLLGAGFMSFISDITHHALREQFVVLLDQVLLILLVIELLYTVQVSFREHALVAEPFLVVALIAVIRRILVVTAEAAHLPEATQDIFKRVVTELGMLTIMVLVLVGSLVILQRSSRPSTGRDGDTPHAS